MKYIRFSGDTIHAVGAAQADVEPAEEGEFITTTEQDAVRPNGNGTWGL